MHPYELSGSLCFNLGTNAAAIEMRHYLRRALTAQHNMALLAATLRPISVVCIRTDENKLVHLVLIAYSTSTQAEHQKPNASSIARYGVTVLVWLDVENVGSGEDGVALTEDIHRISIFCGALSDHGLCMDLLSYVWGGADSTATASIKLTTAAPGNEAR